MVIICRGGGVALHVDRKMKCKNEEINDQSVAVEIEMQNGGNVNSAKCKTNFYLLDAFSVHPFFFTNKQNHHFLSHLI